MRSQPTSTSGRRLLALVSGALLLGVASVGFDAATAHAATIGLQDAIHAPSRFPVEFAGRAYTVGQPIPRGHVVNRRHAVRPMLLDIATLPDSRREVLLTTRTTLPPTPPTTRPRPSPPRR
jgi:hypothetical protein